MGSSPVRATTVSAAACGTCRASRSLTGFVLDSKLPADEIELPLQPCKPFTVRFVDPLDVPFRLTFVGLAPPEAADFPNACRVRVFCDQDGVARLEHILPGPYDVEFTLGTSDPFRLRLDLQPDLPPIVVKRP